MRSSVAAGLLGVGGIFVSFGAVILVLALIARNGDFRSELPAMWTLATGSLVVGAVMFVLGYLLNRMGRGSSGPSAA